MVKMVVKNSGGGKEEFLYEAACSMKVDDLVDELVKIWNLRKKLKMMADLLMKLAEYGPMKSGIERGIDHVKDEELLAQGGVIPKRCMTYREDPMGDRTGEPPALRLQDVLKEVAKQARELISHANFKLITLKEMEAKLSTMKGAVMMAYPMGLPSWDPIYLLLNQSESTEVEGSLVTDETELWWAGKEFVKGTMLRDRLGSNEKTSIKCRLVKKGSGAPQREPIISEEERKAMLAHYFRKQEDNKKLQENDEDYYLKQDWANPKGLKNKLQGTQNLRMF